MDNLIYRQAAINAINHICPVDTECDCTLLDRVDVRCVLSDLPPAQPEQRWTLCSERLPEPNLSVLVQLNDNFIERIQIMTLNISKWDGDFFCFWKTQEMGIDFDMDYVVAWMPLPELWKGEEDGRHDKPAGGD